MILKEKAKRYDEVIERANSLLSSNQLGNAWIYKLLPELKESENERIRKNIKIALMSMEDNLADFYSTHRTSQKELLTWLEKQGETFTKKDVDDAYLKGICEAKQELEKQDSITKLNEEEQNRFAKGVLTSCAMSFIDYLDAHKYEGKMCVSNGECVDIENAFHNAMWDRLHRYYCKYIEKQGEQETVSKVKIGEKYRCCNSVRYTCFQTGKVYEVKDSFDAAMISLCSDCFALVDDNAEQKPADITDEWIEEYWQHEKVNNPYSYNKGDEIQFDYQGFVSFCKKYCQKPAWSEEDEKVLEDVRDNFEFNKGEMTDELIAQYDKWFEKIKSLRPQSQWKPSDEQFKVLNEVLNFAANHESPHWNDYIFGTLNHLIKQLKKLK